MRNLLLMTVFAATLHAQQQPPAGNNGRQYQQEDRKRILGIMPNFRTTSVDAKDILPLSTKEKFKLATRSSFDPGGFVTTAMLTGLTHWQRQYEPDIPLGARGYAWRYGMNFVDNVSAAYFIEGIVPSLIKQDPRYFRKGEGRIINRLGYAISRLAVARSDKGKWMLNGAQLGGNFAAAGIGDIYYPAAQRSWENTFVRYGIDLGTDALTNLGREFWPDVAKLLSRR